MVLLAGPLQSGMEAWAARRISARAARALAGVAGEYVLSPWRSGDDPAVVLVHFGRLSWSALRPCMDSAGAAAGDGIGGAAMLGRGAVAAAGRALAWPLGLYHPHGGMLRNCPRG
jgi:hypothetical protein